MLVENGMPNQLLFDIVLIGNYTKDTVITQSGTRQIDGGGFNYAQYSNPMVDDLLDKARAAQTQDERKKIYQDLAKIVADDVPWVYLNFEPAFELHTPKVQNYSLVADGIIRLEGLWLS